MMRTIGIIPARYGSTRFPGKPLADILGRPMIWHVYQRCLKARYLDQVLVATDDKRIYNCVNGFGGRAVMTSKKHRSGTDRIVEALERIETRNPRFDVIINIQGDEPLIDPKAIDLLAKAMSRDKSIEMATLFGDFSGTEDLCSPDTAKIVADKEGFALYFSRAVIPASRDGARDLANHRKHIGIYGYRRGTLFKLISWRQSSLEKIEKLEQLRALENGVRIKLLKSGYRPQAVDTPEDLIKISRGLKGQSFA